MCVNLNSYAMQDARSIQTERHQLQVLQWEIIRNISTEVYVWYLDALTSVSLKQTVKCLLSHTRSLGGTDLVSTHQLTLRDQRSYWHNNLCTHGKSLWTRHGFERQLPVCCPCVLHAFIAPDGTITGTISIITIIMICLYKNGLRECSPTQQIDTLRSSKLVIVLV